MDEDAQHETGSPELFMFLASTVHDMKDSISVLSGTLENLLVNAPAVTASPSEAPSVAGATPDYAQLAHMLYQTKRLNDNLIQLLALYKDVGKPGYPFDPTQQQISELISQVAAQCKILLQHKGITLDIDFPSDLIWTLDEDLVIGVLIHAINNAIRYTRDRLRLAVRVDGDFLELRVEDNGGGFPSSMIAAGVAAMNIQRAGIDFRNNSSGLGLYFSSEVAKMHKHRQRSGSIALENGGVLGGGCFVLRLP